MAGRWEYKVIRLDHGLGGELWLLNPENIESMADVLNPHGADGWEVTGVAGLDWDGNTVAVMVFMKRPKAG